ncbi:hypothetical protein ACFX2J_035039 [Malus domestica]
MCIAVFVWQNHPVYPFLLLLNRDEFHSRPTEPLAWWEGGEILGGRDGLAGGTWLACTRDGKVAFITNVREVQKLAQAKSRGDLPVRFLESKKSPMEFADEVVEEADQYNGFNLVLADLCSRTMVYVTNRPKEDRNFVTEVSPGIHVLSNAQLDSPWPKAQLLGDSFRETLMESSGDDLPIKLMVEKLMTNTVKVEDESLLPHIYPPELEYHLSSIFVEKAPPLGHYGTRSTSALSVKTNGEVSYYERYQENQVWKEGTVTYQIVDVCNLYLGVHESEPLGCARDACAARATRAFGLASRDDALSASAWVAAAVLATGACHVVAPACGVGGGCAPGNTYKYVTKITYLQEAPPGHGLVQPHRSLQLALRPPAVVVSAIVASCCEMY